jgi:cytochrome c biogenesis factor
MKTNTIENAAEKHEPKFLDAKKITFIVLALVIMVGLVAITCIFVLKDFSFSQLFDSIKAT